jgi:hypothetical protein
MGDPDRSNGPDEPKIVAFRQKPKESPPLADEPNQASRTRANIAALIFAAILVLVGWLLVQKLGQNARMEDCLMSGRTNCNPIAMPRE